MWSVLTLARLRDLQSKQSWSEGAFSIIFVEVSGHEILAVWRRSNLENKIWHSGHYRHITSLKRTHKQVKIHYSVIYKTTRIRSERILSVSNRIIQTFIVFDEAFFSYHSRNTKPLSNTALWTFIWNTYIHFFYNSCSCSRALLGHCQ